MLKKELGKPMNTHLIKTTRKTEERRGKQEEKGKA